MMSSHVKLENENFVDAGIASNDVAGTCSTVFFFSYRLFSLPSGKQCFRTRERFEFSDEFHLIFKDVEREIKRKQTLNSPESSCTFSCSFLILFLFLTFSVSMR